MMGDATRRVEMAGLPQALDVEHFAQARIQELELLDVAVAAVSAGIGGAGMSSISLRGDVGTRFSAGGGLQDQSQALPRHMRRRTTSHKPRRMPVALKHKNNTHLGSSTSKSRERRRHGEAGGSDQELGKDADPEPEEARRCRKHRRRPRALLEMHSPHAAGEEGGGDINDDEKGPPEAILPPRWLETHIWHAKRMHMKEKWGFVLPAESNRGPRAAAEAALKHCTVQDITFMRPLELRGPSQCILGALSVLTDPMDSRPTQQDCVDGSVEACTHLYRVNEFPLGCVAPVSLLWGPSDTVSANTPVATPGPHGGGGTQQVGGGGQHEVEEQEREKGIQNEAGDEEGSEEGIGNLRCLWIWVHPAAAKEALREIRKACALEGSPWQGAVQAGPVPGGLCRLRVRGARSHETVQRVFKTAPPSPKSTTDTVSAALAGGFEDAARDNAGYWQALAPSPVQPGGGGGNVVGAPRLLPSGSVLAITALDPREEKQRHRNRASADSAGSGKKKGPVESGRGSSTDAAATAAVVEQWPPRWAAVSPLWDPDARALAAGLVAARPDHVLNEIRRRQRAREAWDNGDGAAVAAAAAAAAAASSTHAGRSGALSREGSGGATPVILVSASGAATLAHGVASTPASTPASMATAVDIFAGVGGRNGGGGAAGKAVERKRRGVAAGWDIILPAGWAPVFFGALVMAGARALSLKDADRLRLESGEPCFPVDFPDTTSGRRHWDQVGQEAAAAWTRTRPKHRGFKRRPAPRPASLPGPTQPLPLPVGPDEPEGAITGEAVIGGGGGGAGGAETEAGIQAGAEREPRGQGGRQQNDPETAQTPSSLSLPASSFRPDFGFIAAGGVFMPTSVEAVIDTMNSSRTGDGNGVRGVEGAEEPAALAGGEGAASDTSRHCEEEVDGRREQETFAVARGFHYAKAFLPDQEAEGAQGRSSLADDRADSGGIVRKCLALPPAPPLRLAFPTVLELMILQDRGVPEAGALIHAASPDHHALWIQGRQDGKLWPGLPPSALPSTSSLSSLASTPAAVLAGVSAAAATLDSGDDPAAALTAIGAVTSGGFSFLRGGGMGRAVCEAVAVRDAFWTSLSCSRRHQGGHAAGKGQHRWQQGRPWALVFVGDKAGSWLRPAVAFVADS